MRPIRRTDMSPRVELTPLLDVVFLLLTFFIFSVTVMIHVNLQQVRYVTLAAADPAEKVAGSGGVPDAILIDKDCQLFFNQKPIQLDELGPRLAAITADAKKSRVYLAVEQGAKVNQLPLFVEVEKKIKDSGLTEVRVSQPEAH